MPIYEYTCPNCNHQFEQIRAVRNADDATCPACGEDHVRRLVSASAFQFKGSGWYITDYARKGGKRSGASDRSSGTDGATEKKAQSGSEG